MKQFGCKDSPSELTLSNCPCPRRRFNPRSGFSLALKAKQAAIQAQALSKANTNNARQEALDANKARANSSAAPPVVFNGAPSPGKRGAENLYPLLIMKTLSEQVGVNPRPER